MTDDGQESGAYQEDANLGRVLAGHYRIDALIGEGGMGAVYRGCQLSINRPVAIKVITPRVLRKEEHIQRFRREAAATGQLGHPNTVRLFDFGETEDGELFMVMELLQGRDLSAQLSMYGPLSVVFALDVTRQVMRGLAEAHALGIVHRDLKPGNVFLATLSSGESMVKVMDFGVAALDGPQDRSRITTPGDAIGTPAYMAPEQALGEPVDARADLYASGIMLFEMLTGRPPFEAESMFSLLSAHVSQPPPRLQEVAPALAVSPDVQHLLDHLLGKRPGHRPNSAVEVIQALDSLLLALTGSPSVSTPISAISLPSAQPATGELLPTAETLPDTAHALVGGRAGVMDLPVGSGHHHAAPERRGGGDHGRDGGGHDRGGVRAGGASQTPRAWTSARPVTKTGSTLFRSAPMVLGAVLAASVVVAAGFWWNQRESSAVSDEHSAESINGQQDVQDGELSDGRSPGAHRDERLPEVSAAQPPVAAPHDYGRSSSRNAPLQGGTGAKGQAPPQTTVLTPQQLPPPEIRGPSKGVGAEPNTAGRGRSELQARWPKRPRGDRGSKRGLGTDIAESGNRAKVNARRDDDTADNPGALGDPSSVSSVSATNSPSDTAADTQAVPSLAEVASADPAHVEGAPADPATERIRELLASPDPQKRRSALLRRGLEYNSLNAVERARAAGKLDLAGYDDHIWVLRHRHSVLMRKLEADRSAGIISDAQYKARRAKIERDLHGE